MAIDRPTYIRLIAEAESDDWEIRSAARVALARAAHDMHPSHPRTQCDACDMHHAADLTRHAAGHLGHRGRDIAALAASLDEEATALMLDDLEDLMSVHADVGW